MTGASGYFGSSDHVSFGALTGHREYEMRDMKSVEAARRAHWRDHYIREMLRVEADLKYARTRQGAWLCQVTPHGEIDATQQYIDGLRAAYEEYRAEAEFWSKPG